MYDQYSTRSTSTPLDLRVRLVCIYSMRITVENSIVFFPIRQLRMRCVAVVLCCRRSVSGGAGTAGATAGRTPTQNALVEQSGRLNSHRRTRHRQHCLVMSGGRCELGITGTAGVVCRAGSMHLSSVRPSVRLSVCPIRPLNSRTMLLRVCCCGPGGLEISSINFCTAGGQQQPRRSTARSSKGMQPSQ